MFRGFIGWEFLASRLIFVKNFPDTDRGGFRVPTFVESSTRTDSDPAACRELFKKRFVAGRKLCFSFFDLVAPKIVGGHLKDG